MLFTITGKHVEITEAIRNYAREKCEKLPRFYDQISHMEVVVEAREGGSLAVQFLAHVDRGEVLVAKEEGHDLYGCLDLTAHKMERQLKRQKEKQRDHKRPGTADLPLPERPGEEGTIE